MKLSDARRVSIKQGVRIRFVLPNGMACVMNEHGLAQIPQLAAPPNFDLEQEFAGVEQFTLEPVPVGKENQPTRPVTRSELAALAGSAPEAESHHDDE